MAKQNIVQGWKSKADVLNKMLGTDWAVVQDLVMKGMALERLFKEGLDRRVIVDYDFDLSDEFNSLEEVMEWFKEVRGNEA